MLIIDDDELVLESIVLLLSVEPGLDTIRARGSADALHHLKGSRHIDVIVADVILSGSISGLDICEKAIELHPAIAVVVITADPETHRSDVATRGVFLRKPFGAAPLLAAIAQSQQQIPRPGHEHR
ncbi:MAG: response regulator [Rhodanobacter sp.]